MPDELVSDVTRIGVMTVEVSETSPAQFRWMLRNRDGNHGDAMQTWGGTATTPAAALNAGWAKRSEVLAAFAKKQR